MKTKVLAIALATLAATVAADVASARDAVRISEGGQVTVQRHRKAYRVQVPSIVTAGNVIVVGSPYGWTAPYVGTYGGYGYSIDW